MQIFNKNKETWVSKKHILKVQNNSKKLFKKG